MKEDSKSGVSGSQQNEFIIWLKTHKETGYSLLFVLILSVILIWVLSIPVYVIFKLIFSFEFTRSEACAVASIWYAAFMVWYLGREK